MAAQSSEPLDTKPSIVQLLPDAAARSSHETFQQPTLDSVHSVPNGKVSEIQSDSYANLLGKTLDSRLSPQFRHFFCDLVFNYLAALILVILFESPGISLEKFFVRGRNAAKTAKN